MSAQIFGTALSPINVTPIDQIISTVTYTNTIYPPYQSVSSGSYTIYINQQSDLYLTTDNKGTYSNVGYYNYSTVAEMLIPCIALPNVGANGFFYQYKNENYLTFPTRMSPLTICYGIAWNGSIYIAVGSGNACIIASSVDGISWSPRERGVYLATPYGVAWSGSLWIVVGSANTLNSSTATQYVNTNISSPDGIIWSPMPNTGVYQAAPNPRKLAYSLQLNFVFSLQSDNQYFYWTSTTGTTFVQRYTLILNGPIASPSYFYTIYWSGQYFIALNPNTVAYTGNNASSNSAYSTDGITWNSYGILANQSGLTNYYPGGIIFLPIQNAWICSANGSFAATNPLSYTTASPPVSGWTATATTTLPSAVKTQGTQGFVEIINNGTNIIVFNRGTGHTSYYVALASYTAVTWTSVAVALTNGVISAVYAPSITTHVAGGIFTTSSALSYTTTAGGTAGWTLATGSGFTTQVNQVAWNGTNQFVAVGQGTNVIAYSANGQTWTGIPASTATFTTSGNGITWNSSTSLWVASGSGGPNTFLSSPDGINWTPRLLSSSGVDTTARGVAYSPALSQWVMVGSGNHSISTSIDGSTWTGVTLLTIFSTSGYGIVWAPLLGIWVAGGAGTNTIATSSDGINWTARTSPFTTQVNNIFWNGTLFVAVGSGTYSIASSLDGIIWTGRSATGTPLATGTSVTYSTSLSLWVAYGTLGTSNFATSPDGSTWTGGSTGTAIIASGGYTLAWSSTLGQFVAGGNGANSMVTSQDGFNWNASIQVSTFNNYGLSIVWSGTIWVAASQAGPIWSNDGVTWTQGTGNGISLIYGVAFNGSQQRPLFVMCGSTTTSNIMSSVDGKAWSSGSTLAGAPLLCVIWAPYQSLWLAGTSGSYTFTSPDAVTWTQRATGNVTINCFVAYRNIILQCGPSTSIYTTTTGYTWTAVASVGGFGFAYTIAYSPTLGIWVVGGNGSYINYSTNNGTSWTTVNMTLFAQTISIIWNGIYFFATGYSPNTGLGGSYITATSTDGINWRGGISSTTTSINVLGVPAMRAPIAVMGGQGTYALSYSLDGGLSWTMNPNLLTIFGAICNCVAWNGYIWVAGGQTTNTFASSPDGITWTGRGAAVISTAVYDIVWATSLKLWVAVGAGTNSIATSPNGYNWTGRTLLTIFPTRGDKVSWNGNQLLAVGAGTANYPIATSSDGIIWTAILVTTVTPASAAGRAAIVWNGVYNYWILTTNGSTGIFTSPDGSTWTNRKTQTNNGSTLAWNGQSHIAVDTLGASYTSPDGITWTNATTSPLTTNTWRITWSVSSSLWILTGLGPTVASGTFYTSASTPNGITWTPRTSSVAGMSDTSVTQPRGFVYAPSLGLWAGAVGFTTQIVTAPTGGTPWTGRAAAVFGAASTGNGGTCVAWSGTYFLMGGAGGTAQLYYSSDGITWTSAGNGGATWTRVNSLLWHAAQSRWIGAGQNGTTSGVLAYSTVATGASGWTVPATGTTTFTGGTTSSANGLTYRVSDGLIVAVGIGTSPSATVFAWSSDFGATWTRATTVGITTLGQAVVYASSPIGASSNFVATGSGGSSIATSPDGSNWTGRTSVFSTQGWAIAASPTAVVALGSGTNASAISYDNGVTWIAQGFSNFGTAGLGIGWGSTAGEWVAWAVTGGAGILYTSQDGNSWIQRHPNFTTQGAAIGYQLGGREKTLTLSNTQWTGRTNTQTFKIISAANSS